MNGLSSLIWVTCSWMAAHFASSGAPDDVDPGRDRLVGDEHLRRVRLELGDLLRRRVLGRLPRTSSAPSSLSRRLHRVRGPRPGSPARRASTAPTARGRHPRRRSRPAMLGGQLLRVPGRIAGPLEGADRDVVGPDVVGVAVPAEVVVGRDDVGLVAPDEPRRAGRPPRRGRPARSSAGRGCPADPSCRSRGSRGSPTRSRRGCAIARSSSPARISPSRRWFSGVSIVRDDDLAHLAARAGDEDDPMAGRDGLGHRAAGPDRLVVGVGVDGHQGGAMGAARIGVGGGGRVGHAADASAGRGSAPGRGATIARWHAPHGPGAARRPARRRLLDGPGRAVLHDAPRRSRGGRRQGRATRGRRDPRLGSAVGRRRGGRDANRRLLPRGQPQQAQRSGSTSSRTAGAEVLRRLLGARRRARRELPAGRARAPRASTTTSSQRLNPGLVHLAISGYGADGPAADRPGYDFVIQAVERPDVDHRRAPTRTAAARPRSASRSATS